MGDTPLSRLARDRIKKPCLHCGLPTLASEDAEKVFCCSGCMGAYAMIHELGLESFYDLRGAQSIDSVASNSARQDLLENLEASGVVVHPTKDGLCSVRLSVDGVHCAACSWLIERMQPSIRGLHSAQVRMSDQTIELIYDPEQTSPANVSKKLSKLGYTLSPWIADELDSVGFLKQQREHWTGIALAAFFAANAMWIGVALYAGESTGIQGSHEYFLRWVGTILALMAVIFPGRLFLETAWQSIRSRTPHIDIPVALSLVIGSLGSLVGAVRGIGHIYFDSLASLILLLRIGRYIQYRAQYRTSQSVSGLLRSQLSVASKLDSEHGFQTTKIPSYRLQPKDVVIVHPGEIIPADGTICSIDSTEKTTFIDESLLTGESRPVAARINATVLGGTTNLTSPIRVEVTASGESSRIGKLMELVRRATSHRTPWIMAADRIGKWFVLIILGLAVGTFVVWSYLANTSIAVQHTMALLTIACPCALALAAPLVLTVALGRAAKQNIWIRDGNCLEKLATPGILWLDKTGTLTYGRMTVLEWHGDDRWISYAAALERSVKHPIASAILEYRSNFDLPSEETAERVQVQHGLGTNGFVSNHEVCIGNEELMRSRSVDFEALNTNWPLLGAKLLAQGLSVVWLAVDKQIVGVFGIGDTLRADTIDSLQQIQRLGWRLAIISGDRQEVVDHLVRDFAVHGIGIQEAYGQQSPEQKLERIRGSMQTQAGPSVMVGDGVNDAAALALADVGMAIRGGCEQSLHAAPIYIGNQKLSSVVRLMHSAQSVVAGIKRCFVASLIYNSMTITLAMMGWIHPLIAAVLMPISGLTVLVMAITTQTFPNMPRVEDRK